MFDFASPWPQFLLLLLRLRFNRRNQGLQYAPSLPLAASEFRGRRALWNAKSGYTEAQVRRVLCSL